MLTVSPATPRPLAVRLPEASMASLANIGAGGSVRTSECRSIASPRGSLRPFPLMIDGWMAAVRNGLSVIFRNAGSSPALPEAQTPAALTTTPPATTEARPQILIGNGPPCRTILILLVSEHTQVTSIKVVRPTLAGSQEPFSRRGPARCNTRHIAYHSNRTARAARFPGDCRSIDLWLTQAWHCLVGAGARTHMDVAASDRRRQQRQSSGFRETMVIL